jgi:surface polysaccharide O-acyltransferase-like enzyme
VNALTEWLPFVGYFLAGAWLATSPLRTDTARRFAAVAVGAAGVTVALTALLLHLYGWTPTGRYLLGYQSPTVIVMSVAVFRWARARAATAGWRSTRTLHRLAGATFGVFLVHPLILVPLLARTGRPTTTGGVLAGVPAIVLLVAVVAAAATIALARVPILRRVVG